jgi:hypothetical protein
MKVAELFVELGFAVKGEDKLKEFETSLISAAAAAKSLVASLTQLVGLKLPQPGAASQAAPSSGRRGGYGQFNQMMGVGAPLPGNSAFIGPLAPTAAPVAGNTAVVQGIKQFGLFAKQLLGIGSLAYVLKHLVSSMVDLSKAAMKASFTTDKFSKQTGLSREELKRWEYAATGSGVSSEEIQTNLAKLAQQSFGILRGENLEAASVASGYGIDLLQSAGDILKQFGQKAAGLSLVEAQWLASKVGISPDVAYMMREIRGLVPSITPGQALTDEQQTKTMKAAAASEEAGVAFTALMRKWTADIADGLTIFAEARRNFYQSLISPSPKTDYQSLFMGPTQFRQSPTANGNTTVTNNIQIDGSGNPEATGNAVQKAVTGADYQRFNFSYGRNH